MINYWLIVLNSAFKAQRTDKMWPLKFQINMSGTSLLSSQLV